MADVRRCLLLWALAGCAFDRSGVPGDDAPPIDAARGPDGDSPDGAVGCVPWDALNVDPCDGALPEPDTINLASGDFVYDTDTGTLSEQGGGDTTPASALLTQARGPEVRALNVRSFNIDAAGSLTVVGSRPLVIVVHGSASIAGTIDVSARVTGEGTSTPGPGGNSAECGNGAGEPGKPSTNANAGGGGGGGGGFGDDGGDGGDGNGAGHGGKGGKGAKNGAADLVPLRGGCAGGAGGADALDPVNPGGRAGDGGGAIEITALGTIEVSGAIRAGGSGGATQLIGLGGGGGAGSGGAILLDADVAIVSASAALCGNGGGGGEGGQILETSEDGEPATCSETIEAQGGALSPGGGDGGDGGALIDLTGDNATNGASGGGGGGGGGGVGRIRVRGRTTRDVPDAAIISPDAAN
jgi:hypothetical protein